MPVQHLSDDERYEQTMAASASERRNRPTHLLIVPIGLFCIAAIMLAYALYSSESARVRLEQKQQQYTQLVQGVVQVKELENAGRSSGSADLFKPIPDVLTRSQSYANEAGLDPAPSIPSQMHDRVQGHAAERVRYIYRNVSNSSLEPMLAWVKLMTERVPGMFVYSISVKPAGANGWTMDITFARWEREGTS